MNINTVYVCVMVFDYLQTSLFGHFHGFCHWEKDVICEITLVVHCVTQIISFCFVRFSDLMLFNCYLEFLVTCLLVI